MFLSNYPLSIFYYLSYYAYISAYTAYITKSVIVSMSYYIFVEITGFKTFFKNYSYVNPSDGFLI